MLCGQCDGPCRDFGNKGERRNLAPHCRKVLDNRGTMIFSEVRFVTEAPTFSAVDLFSGCGGLTQGLKKAGFEVIGAIEKDSSAAATYAANHPKVALVVDDIRVVDEESFRTDLGIASEDLTLLAGCAPCQGFSRHRRGDSTDDRNDLVLEILRFVQSFKPLIVFMENVPEITRASHRMVLDGFIDGLRQLGYLRVETKSVNAADYGVPQLRNRFALLATRHETLDVKIPDGRFARPDLAKQLGKAPWRTVRQTIAHLPALSVGEQSLDHPLHVAGHLSQRNVQRLASISTDGGSRASLPESYRLPCHNDVKGYSDTYGRMKWDEPCRTLTTGCTSITKGRFGHPEQDRGITPLEAALLQTFPITYRFPCPPTAAARQIGNAVPVDLAFGIFKEMHQRLSS